MSTRQASDILKELFSSMKIDPSQETIFEAWPELVGSEAASHLKIQDIKGKTLLLLAYKIYKENLQWQKQNSNVRSRM